MNLVLVFSSAFICVHRRQVLDMLFPDSPLALLARNERALSGPQHPRARRELPQQAAAPEIEELAVILAAD
jgi:hypothetical protein